MTRLLRSAADGDPGATSALYELTYEELKTIARRELRRIARGQTLQTTVVVHEVYLKLFGSDAGAAENRRHFFALASRVMRQILVDHYRVRASEKRGGRLVRVELDERDLSEAERADLLLAVNEALERLGALNERLVRVVECLFFGGMTQEETAAALDISVRTVRNDWRKAKAFLSRELARGA